MYKYYRYHYGLYGAIPCPQPCCRCPASAGATGPIGPRGQTGMAGPPGPAGPTEATGPEGTVPDDISASFIGSSELFTNGSQLLLFPAVTDPTGTITESDLMHVQLAAGYYFWCHTACPPFSIPPAICR